MDSWLTIHNPWYLLISAVGLYVLFNVLRSRRQASASQNWVGVQGRIVESRLEKRSSTAMDISDRDQTSYIPIIRYTYSVMGQEYSADRVAFGVQNTNQGPARELVERYPVEKSVMVYYDPNHPDQAVLEQVSKTGWLQIVVGILMVFAGLYLTVR